MLSIGGGGANLFLGVAAGAKTAAAGDTFSGAFAGDYNTSGADNTFSGSLAGTDNTTGGCKHFPSGIEAGIGNTTGDINTFLGVAAGTYNKTGSSNTYISNQGPSSGTESNTIRIGMQGTGDGQQNAAYMAGIFGSTVDNNGIPVYVDDNGQLGTVVSSLRFKEQIADMGDSTNALLKLRPVTFLYKPEYAKGERTLQYGLIAEEVAKVYPELVAYDKDGQPYTVKYQYLAPMLLNELQKQHTVVAAQQDVIKTQQEQIINLQQRLARLESLPEKK